MDIYDKTVNSMLDQIVERGDYDYLKVNGDRWLKDPDVNDGTKKRIQALLSGKEDPMLKRTGKNTKITPNGDVYTKPAPTTESATSATNTSTKATPTSQSTNPSPSTQAPKPEPTITGPAEGSSTSGTKNPNLADLADDSEGAYMREDTVPESNTSTKTGTKSKPSFWDSKLWKYGNTAFGGALGAYQGWNDPSNATTGDKVANATLEGTKGAVLGSMGLKGNLAGIALEYAKEYAKKQLAEGNVDTGLNEEAKQTARDAKHYLDSVEQEANALGLQGDERKNYVKTSFAYRYPGYDIEKDVKGNKLKYNPGQTALNNGIQLKKGDDENSIILPEPNSLYQNKRREANNTPQKFNEVAPNTDTNANANTVEAKNTNTDNSNGTPATPIVVDNNKNNTSSTETTTPTTPTAKVSPKNGLYYTGGNKEKAKSHMKTLWSEADENYINSIRNTADFKQSRAEYDAPEYKGLSNEKKDQRAAADILELQKRADAKKKVAPKSGTVYNAPAKTTSKNTEENTGTIDLKNINWSNK